IKVKTFSFQAPAAGQARRISFPSSTGGVAVSISNQCGNFDVPTACRGVASSSISWSTEANAAGSKCKLDAGRTYYLNFAWFNYPEYLSRGVLESTCKCPGPNCACSGNHCESMC